MLALSPARVRRAVVAPSCRRGPLRTRAQVATYPCPYLCASSHDTRHATCAACTYHVTWPRASCSESQARAANTTATMLWLWVFAGFGVVSTGASEGGA
eukprot:7049587-Prymnesium_polylepis.1